MGLLIVCVIWVLCVVSWFFLGGLEAIFAYFHNSCDNIDVLRLTFSVKEL